MKAFQILPFIFLIQHVHASNPAPNHSSMIQVPCELYASYMDTRVSEFEETTRVNQELLDRITLENGESTLRAQHQETLKWLAQIPWGEISHDMGAKMEFYRRAQKISFTPEKKEDLSKKIISAAVEKITHELQKSTQTTENPSAPSVTAIPGSEKSPPLHLQYLLKREGYTQKLHLLVTNKGEIQTRLQTSGLPAPIESHPAIVLETSQNHTSRKSYPQSHQVVAKKYDEARALQKEIENLRESYQSNCAETLNSLSQRMAEASISIAPRKFLLSSSDPTPPFRSNATNSATKAETP